MPDLKIYLFLLTGLWALSLPAHAQIDCINYKEKHIHIRPGSKIKIGYAPRPDTSYQLKGRYQQNSNDSIFILRVKGHEERVNIRNVYSIETKSTAKYVKAALIGFCASYLIASTAANLSNSKHSHPYSSGGVLFAASVGAIYITIFNNKLLFLPYQSKNGWKFVLEK